MKKTGIVTSLILSLVMLLLGQDSTRSEAKMVRKPFAGGDSLHAIQEVALDLKGHVTSPDDRVAVRVCSKQQLPVALLTATASPFVLREYLEHYGLKDQQILFLRSEDCLAQDPSLAVTEFWIIPKDAAPPASVESIMADQAQVEVVRTADTIKNANGYSAALRELVQKVNNQPDTVAVVVGSYYRQPSAALKKNLQKARTLLERSNVQPNRSYVLTAPFGGVPHRERKPEYPSLFIFSTVR